MMRPESIMTLVVVFIFMGAALVLTHISGEDLVPLDRSGGEAPALLVAGSTTLLPFAEACAVEFNQEERDLVVKVSGGGTGAGIDLLEAGEIDMAMASRKVGEYEMERLGYRIEEHPIALDAVSIVVSRPIWDAGITDLSHDQLSGIYSGGISNWKELGGPDRGIVAVSRSPGSGTGEIFSEKVATPGVSVYVETSEDVARYVAGSDRAIGYLGLNLAFYDDLGIVAYEGTVPSAETVRDGSYPLARTLYMYTWGEPDEGERAYLEFVTGEKGQAIAESVGFVPIST